MFAEARQNSMVVLWLTLFILSNASPNPSTCPSKTANYITHSLPQQCLATVRHGSSVNSTEVSSPGNHSVASSSSIWTETSPFPSTQLTAPTTTTASSSFIPTNLNPSADSGASVAAPSETGATDDEDSPLENSNFMSFEEWKKQNLKRSGQSDHVGRDPKFDFVEHRKRPGSVHNALDSLGDEAEIELDFSGFVPGGPDPAAARELFEPESDLHGHASSLPSSLVAAQGRPRSRDAGTTCKERFNYASFDCAANVLKTNREAKSPNAILVENKDAYMLNECHAKDKYLVLELCNDISIDTIVLANFEFFSSTFRTFRVSVSDRYPVKADKWLDIGLFEARNTREVQAFLVENPRIWARYLRIELLTHYGNEFYCPVSLIRVHGTTMLEEYKHDQDLTTLDTLENEVLLTGSHDQSNEDVFTPEAIAIPPIETLVPEPEPFISIVDDEDPTPSLNANIPLPQATLSNVENYIQATIEQHPVAQTAALQAIASIVAPTNTCALDPHAAHSCESAADSGNPQSKVIILKDIAETRPTSDTASSKPDRRPSTRDGAMLDPQRPTRNQTQKPSSLASVSMTESGVSPAVLASTSQQSAEPSANSTNSRAVSSTTKTSSGNTDDRSKMVSSTTQTANPAPTMQESFFKSVQKRLQMLEANSSLSLQYIEDQSRSLRDAFKKVEQRQLSKTTSFLDQLNSTVLNELREFRQQYDQLWQSTVIELELQRERYERDNEAMNVRLGILADEVIFQRRMSILQMILILVCLTLVLFSRGSINNYLELPLVQNVLSKSPSTRWLNLSGVDSPSSTPQITRARSAHELRSRHGILKGHRRMQSEDSTTDTLSVTDMYAPPTPISFDEQSETEMVPEHERSTPIDSDKDAVFDDPAYDPATIQRPLTSPPMLTTPSLSDTVKPDHETLSSYTSAWAVEPSVLHSQPTPQLMKDTVSPVAKRLAWNLPND